MKREQNRKSVIRKLNSDPAYKERNRVDTAKRLLENEQYKTLNRDRVAVNRKKDCMKMKSTEQNTEQELEFTQEDSWKTTITERRTEQERE